jgi:hypothetical protein
MKKTKKLGFLALASALTMIHKRPAKSAILFPFDLLHMERFKSVEA